MRIICLALLAYLPIVAAAPALALDIPAGPEPTEHTPLLQEVLEQAPPVIAGDSLSGSLPQPEYTFYVPAEEPEVEVPNRESFIARVCGSPEPPPTMVVYQPAQEFDGFSALVRNPYDPQPVPEPGTAASLGAGFALTALRLFRRSR